MPIEVVLLANAPKPDRCPNCWLDFDPFLRGQVGEERFWIMTGRTCLICRHCKKVIGYESVIEGRSGLSHTYTLKKFHREPLWMRIWDLVVTVAAYLFVFGFGLLCLFAAASVWIILVCFEGRRPNDLSKV